MTKATIKDICQATGLSIGTVSKYLNGGKLREANRAKLDAAVEKLGYEVDEYARGLVTHRTRTVGVLLPEFDNMFYAQIVSNIEAAFNQYGYAAIVRDSRRDPKRELNSIRWFVARRVDALVIVPCCKRAADYAALADIDIPIVFLDMWIEGLNVEYVIVNNREISRLGVDYLIKRGHREIAIVSAPEGVYTADQRLLGYRQAFEENGLAVNNSLCYRVAEDMDSAYRLIKDILSEKRCSALFASNLPSTYGAIFAVNELRLSVPNELSLLGFDDMMFTRVFRPRLSIIDQPISDIAETTVKRILELLTQEQYEYRKNCLQCELIVNDSVADYKSRK